MWIVDNFTAPNWSVDEPVDKSVDCCGRVWSEFSPSTVAVDSYVDGLCGVWMHPDSFPHTSTALGMLSSMRLGCCTQTDELLGRVERGHEG